MERKRKDNAKMIVKTTTRKESTKKVSEENTQNILKTKNNSKKYKIIIISSIVIIVITFLIIFIDKKTTQYADTSYEDRIKWNNFLKNIPNLSEIKTLPVKILIPPSDNLLKISLTSKLVKEEGMTDKDYKKYALPTKSKGYKKKIKDINKFLKNNLNVAFIKYNEIETYIKDNEFLIIDDNYVYYSKIKVENKVFIVMELDCEDEICHSLIYEYTLNNRNKKRIYKMLKTGKIRTTVKAEKYYIQSSIKDDNIKILKKEMLDHSTDEGTTIKDVLEDYKRMYNIDKDVSEIKYKIIVKENGGITVKILEDGEKVNDDDIITNSVDVGG